MRFQSFISNTIRFYLHIRIFLYNRFIGRARREIILYIVESTNFFEHAYYDINRAAGRYSFSC